jgi:hypothetical protein
MIATASQLQLNRKGRKEVMDKRFVNKNGVDLQVKKKKGD